jgi:hypothetical protein
MMYICSEGWRYESESKTVHVVAGGEISARYVSPKPLGTEPLPRELWPDRGDLTGKGWNSRRTQ